MAAFGEKLTQQMQRTLTTYDALKSVTYNSVPAPTLNLTTGTVTATATVSTLSMRLADFRRAEIDGLVVIHGDRKARYPVADFSGTPTIRDTMTIDGTTWEVKRVWKQANEGLWVWHLRRLGDA